MLLQVDVLPVPASLYPPENREGWVLLMCNIFLLCIAAAHVLMGMWSALRFLRSTGSYSRGLLVRSRSSASASCRNEVSARGRGPRCMIISKLGDEVSTCAGIGFCSAPAASEGAMAGRCAGRSLYCGDHAERL